ncbi:aldo-keto reductase [Punctularia strigosozonata HHB-11173 SS5]|uniref:Aldo-keto reductase n=1 Tax=Punctularia strigosozonata (strain HHB-11173) TaxID=741275 RepID=R7S0Q3_PUNST|nr:aldo-keto reductase [Punctularia strigosozonata HHB-11173 SS5]EIN03970.1 aldo-keto reductase [Punctularia strigosozonata HHB-11173 SS5]
MAKLTMQSTVKFHDGNEIPVLGFGTYELDGKAAYDAVTWALEAGYRHIDSAAWYENEREVGQAIQDFCSSTGTPRSAIFYTTKLKLNNGYANVRKAIDRSLSECGLEYIDLYLIHGPLGGPQMRKESWRACIDAKKEGKLRSIGISTFGVGHMKELLSEPGVEVPVCTQIDLHPFMTRTDVVAFCKEHDIKLEAWAPLVRGLRFDHPSIVSFARKYSKQPAQVLIRWSLQKGFIPIPKSASKHRITSNADVFDFELTEEDMAHLDSLDEYLVTDWDPTNCA